MLIKKQTKKENRKTSEKSNETGITNRWPDNIFNNQRGMEWNIKKKKKIENTEKYF